ncbi:unnamed protein product [Cercopithifilaria johnstoni]|uniref:Uncharacterized protein n=1 Tax=Cercopithifilaria johnstoni TaxID=2874296 RepID=A0A8J2PU93_9BILA|nr:unnamed protein product [Cercopithifilaria johnstoni]
MKKSRITCDTEVPMPTSNGNKFSHCSGTYHNYSLPHIITIANDNDKQYDKPQRKDDMPRVKIIGSSSSSSSPSSPSPQRTTINCIYNNQLRNTGIRNYDIPKDIINSNILQSGSQLALPVKQPLLHGHHQKHSESRKVSARPPPPTIVLSPPDETSPEKAKVIFEYDNEKYTIQPNFLIRYKRIILTVAVSLLIFFLLIFVALVVYIAYRRRL